MLGSRNSILLQIFQADWGAAKEFAPEPLARVEGSNWVPVFLFLAFAALVLLRVFDGRRMAQLASGFFRASSVGMLYREENAVTGRASLLLIINYLIITPLFIWQTMGYFNIPRQGVLQYGVLALFITGVYLVKIAGTRLLGLIFAQREASEEYNYTILLFNKILGILLFPITVMMAYAHAIPQKWLVIFGLIVWGIILVYRLFRGILIGLSTSGFSLIHIFLYLCTLEILPFVVILKQFAG